MRPVTSKLLSTCVYRAITAPSTVTSFIFYFDLRANIQYSGV